MSTTINTASLLSLIAPLFSHQNGEDYGHVLQNEGWRDVRAAATALESRGSAALEPLSWAERSVFQNDVLVSGMPFAAMPVESLYKAWSAQPGNEFGATRNLYMGDSARHLEAVYEELGLAVPEQFASMPDHLTLELELLSLLLEAGNGEAARTLVEDHFDWLDDYDRVLEERAAAAEQSQLVSEERRSALSRGFAFTRALVALANNLVHEVACSEEPTEPSAATQ